MMIATKQRKVRRTITLVCAMSLFTANVLAVPERSPAKADLETDTPKRFPYYGGTLRIGHYIPPTVINPVLTDHSISATMLSLVFNSLIRSNEKGRLEPDLAEKWTVSDDGRIYEFWLKRGIRFHDGVELTSDDVIFTFQKIMHPSVKSPYAAFLNVVERIEKTGVYGLRIILKEPSPYFELQLVRAILPKHLYEKEDMRTTPLNHRPVGTGPFRFHRRESMEILLEANEDYYEGRPYLDAIQIKIYPTASAYWSAFMRGEIDLILLMRLKDFEITRKDASFMTFTHPTVNYYALFYDLNDPALLDKRVRLALAHAIDRQALIEIVEHGYGTESLGPFSSDSPGFDPSIKPLGYEPAKAKELLSQAGWQDANGDGLLEKDGKIFFLRVLVDARHDKAPKIAKVLRQQLSQVGIPLSVELYRDYDELHQKSASCNVQLNMYYGGRTNPAAAIKFWHSLEKHHARKVWSMGPFSAELDALIEKTQAFLDSNERVDLYRKLHRKIYGDQFTGFLYFEHAFHAANKHLGNAELFLNLMMPDHRLKDFYLKNEGG